MILKPAVKDSFLYAASDFKIAEGSTTIAGAQPYALPWVNVFGAKSLDIAAILTTPAGATALTLFADLMDPAGNTLALATTGLAPIWSANLAGSTAVKLVFSLFADVPGHYLNSADSDAAAQTAGILDYVFGSAYNLRFTLLNGSASAIVFTKFNLTVKR